MLSHFDLIFSRALETAEENAQRLAGNPAVQLHFPECCETKKELHLACDGCEVGKAFFDCRIFWIPSSDLFDENFWLIFRQDIVVRSVKIELGLSTIPFYVLGPKIRLRLTLKKFWICTGGESGSHSWDLNFIFSEFLIPSLNI